MPGQCVWAGEGRAARGVLQLLQVHGHLVSPTPAVPPCLCTGEILPPVPGAAVHTRLSLNQAQLVPQC